MADEAENKAAAEAPPETREGQVVNFTENRNLIQRAIRNRWIKNLERLDKLAAQNISDVAELRRKVERGEVLVDPMELIDQGIALEKAQAMVAREFGRAVESEKPKAESVTNNTQVNIDARGNEALVAEFKKQLTLEEREKLLAKLESGNGSNGNGNGHH